MPGEGKKFRFPLPQGVALWAPVAALLALGLFTTLIDLSSLPTSEAGRANEQRQRYVVNPLTGEISLGVNNLGDNSEAEFDVGNKEDLAEAPPAPGAPVTPATTAEAATPAEPLPEGMPRLRTEPLTADMTVPAHSKDSLVGAPAPEITETVDGMKLPKRGDKNVLPSKLYSHPFKRESGQALLSFVVMDAGLDPQSTGLLMGLPSEISVAYSPYVHQSVGYSENLRALGHEVWTMLPVMSDRYPSDDPGPMGLVSPMPVEEIIRRLRMVLAAVQGSVGVVLPPNENIAVQKNALVPAINEINKRGLLLLSTHPSRNIDQLTMDKELTPIIHRADLILDPEPNESQIRSKLAGLAKSVTEKGEYVVVLSARPQSLAILADWLKETHFTASLALAPLSALYQSEAVPEAAAEEEGSHGKKKEEKKKDQPKKTPKPLPQDKYRQPAEKSGGH